MEWVEQMLTHWQNIYGMMMDNTTNLYMYITGTTLDLRCFESSLAQLNPFSYPIFVFQETEDYDVGPEEIGNVG
jgi:hypothetical protein